MARGLKFCIQEEEVMYYPSSQYKGADQLRGYRKADLRLCFRICKMLVFSRRVHIFFAYFFEQTGLGHSADSDQIAQSDQDLHSL